ncbi:MAG: thiosulfate sulfurtransferase [Alphaproteobacteria bacterium]|nr:thiosulfate sulfurtransferase [Alphaproteobacteria bacterium]
MLEDGREFALLDVREELIYSQSHLLHARSAPLSRLELLVPALVPRRGTRIVLCDDDETLSTRAAASLARYGYGHVSVLRDGVPGWAGAGYELFSGVFVPSKAFGEFVEHDSGTPSIEPQELDRLLRDKADLVVLDSRPFDEYSKMNIPTGIDVPGAELVLRARELAPSPDTTIVVNCAGRTRSIIGAQSLINAGVPNKVMALRNGTMGWNLAGFACETGQSRRAPLPSSEGLAWAKRAAAQVADAYGVTRIDRERLQRFQAEAADRTLYLFDVRDPDEYRAGHVPGAVSAPGGQLVQATDQYIGTLGARIVLVDDKEVRALMTGSWLRQMGWRDVFVLGERGTETGVPMRPVLGEIDRSDARIETAALRGLVDRGAATVIDLATSRAYRAGHIPGAWFAIRSRLANALPKISVAGTIVLTSEDGVLASLAVDEAKTLTAAPVRCLAGGNAAWARAGYPLEAGDIRMADEPIDAWLKPYERAAGVSAAMSEYLAWEVDLIDRIKRDGTCRFMSRAGRRPE